MRHLLSGPVGRCRFGPVNLQSSISVWERSVEHNNANVSCLGFIRVHTLGPDSTHDMYNIHTTLSVLLPTACCLQQPMGSCECVKKQLVGNCRGICSCLVAQGQPVGGQQMCESVCK